MSNQHSATPAFIDQQAFISPVTCGDNISLYINIFSSWEKGIRTPKGLKTFVRAWLWANCAKKDLAYCSTSNLPKI